MASCILFNMRRSIRSFSIPPRQPQGNRVRSNSHPPRQKLCPYALPKRRVDGQLFCKGQIQRPLYTLLSSHWPSLKTQTLWNLSSEPSAHESELFNFKRPKNTCAPCTGHLSLRNAAKVSFVLLNHNFTFLLPFLYFPRKNEQNKDVLNWPSAWVCSWYVFSILVSLSLNVLIRREKQFLLKKKKKKKKGCSKISKPGI